MEVHPRKERRVAMLACMASLALTLAAQQSSFLSVSGQQGTAKVVQFQGHNFVDVDGLARIVNGSISFQANQMVLTLANGAAAPVPSDAQQSTGFSTGFLRAGIEATARFREGMRHSKPASSEACHSIPAGSLLTKHKPVRL